MSTLQLIEVVVIFVHLAGIVSAVEALYLTRSSQSAIAWCLTLVMFPYISLPLYLIFGRTRFKGYRELHLQLSKANQERLKQYNELLQSYRSATVPLERASETLYEQIAGQEFTAGNEVKLLIDGDAIFQAMFEEIDRAQSFIYVQFFIVRADKIGRELQQRLRARAKDGVKVCWLYDEIGSSALASEYIAELRACGIAAYPFATRQGPGNFFQFNFRNHRKLLIVDGKCAFVGGVNIGDEYLGRNKRLGPWRDTAVKIQGPAVLPLQGIFIADWSWATREVTIKIVGPETRTANQRVLPIATGPADENELCNLLFLQAINSAKSRLWITSPYFVPNEALQRALQLAALRGVDVRILLPNKADHWIVWLASFYYTPDLVRAGAKVFRYIPGFMHQKVMLVDDSLAVVGTVNLDNRSFNLNFELSILVADRDFCLETAKMLERDFNHSEEDRVTSLDHYPPMRRLLSKFARLFSPVL